MAVTVSGPATGRQVPLDEGLAGSRLYASGPSCGRSWVQASHSRAVLVRPKSRGRLEVSEDRVEEFGPDGRRLKVALHTILTLPPASLVEVTAFPPVATHNYS
jgi:hypothetical protein